MLSSLQVLDNTGAKVPGVYTAGVGIAIDPETLLIVEQPKDQSCVLLDDIVFDCVAESPSELTYQWYVNNKVIVGECNSTLTLNGVSLDNRGKYFCCITNQPTGNSRNTENVSLEVRLPDTTEEFDKLQFVHEEIKILQQPILPFKNVKAAIGEKVHLTCLAGCRHKLKYEWLKRGVRSDLIGKIF